MQGAETVEASDPVVGDGPAAPPSSHNDQGFESGAILIVDDYEANLELLRLLFQRRGHRIVGARNGRDALARLRQDAYDLVLLDLMLPDMDGYQVLQVIKSDPLLMAVPVIVVSASSAVQSVVRCIELGADDYLIKPFNPVLLEARVRACLQKKLRHDDEQGYLRTRLAMLSTRSRPGEAAALERWASSPVVDVRTGHLLDALDLAQREREQVEDALRALNATLEERVAERTFLAEQRAADLARAQETLRSSEERYALAARGANDGLWDWDMASGQIYFSPRWKAMLGLADDIACTEPEAWLGRIHPDDRETVETRLTAHWSQLLSHFEHEYRILHADGGYRWMLCRGLAIWGADGKVTRMAGSQTDITARKLAEEQLLHDALHDSLTGLPNRALFLDRLTRTIERSRRNEQSLFAVLILDCDRFKVINDSLGHAAGDALLREVARRLEQNVRLGDTVARMGGDEFALLLDDIADIGVASQVAARIQQALSVPFVLNEREAFSSASIGIALSTTGYRHAADMLRDADTAMYHAKRQGKARESTFDSSMHVNAVSRLQIETDLRRALTRGELRVHYQPIVVLKTGRLAGFEALVRWQHPTRGLIAPGEFLPIAEETGLLVPIGAWVLQEACAQMQRWIQKYPSSPPLVMSVNVAARQLAQDDLPAQVARVLQDTGLPAYCLKLEVTESSLVDNGERAAALLLAIRDLGVDVCIDDFGTGYSSLSYLHQFPINILKIDRSFVSRLGLEGEQGQIIQTIVRLAHSLNLEIIAEGAETAVQREHLVSLECTYGQGWLFSKAVDADAAEIILESGVLPQP